MTAAEWWKTCIVCSGPTGREERPKQWKDDMDKMCPACVLKIRQAKGIEIARFKL